MHRKDYETLAGALRAGVDMAVWEAEPGGILADLSREQVRRMAAVLVAEVAHGIAEGYHSFNPDAWIDECGLAAEVAAVRPTETVRRYGAALTFDDARVGDWIEYTVREGNPIIGRVRSRTDKAVQTENAWALRTGARWPEGRQLRRTQWGSVHVRLVDPAAVWWLEVPEDGGQVLPTTPTEVKPERVPRAEAAQRAMEAARTYLARHGDLRVPAKHVEDGYRLGGWIASQRYDYRHHCLAPDRLRELDALHVSWRHGITEGGPKVRDARGRPVYGKAARESLAEADRLYAERDGGRHGDA